MNKIIIMGFLTRDPEITYKASGDKDICVARYTLAVGRKYKKEGSDDADFIDIVAFDKTGEFVEKYLSKGSKIIVEGRLQTSLYTDKEEKTRKSYVVVAEQNYFCEKKKES